MRESRVFSILFWALIIAPFAMLIVTGDDSVEQQLLTRVADAEDHIEPEALARRLIDEDDSLTLVDVRPKPEYERFHLKGARNIALPDLHRALRRYKNQGDIVLYSNGMTHPAQARDSLQRSGFDNAYLLTDGLDGFIERCLTPVSLRGEPVPAPYAEEINAWRAFFLEAEFSHPIAL
jgi:rhodanese-related sulfurtransferase